MLRVCGIDGRTVVRKLQPIIDNRCCCAQDLCLGKKQPEDLLAIIRGYRKLATGDEIHIIVEARSFLHHQVRNITGSLRLVGNAKWTLRDLRDAFEAKDRKAGGETAPPQGLYLTAVQYKGEAL